MTTLLGHHISSSVTIHVNIGEAKTRLSALLRAMNRGERVIIQRDGKPEAELVPANVAHAVSREEIAAQRRSAFGMYKQAFEGADLGLKALKADRGDPDERYERKFGPSS